MSLRFDGKVAVVTGSGGGLGKAYALALAERGAKVVVNDLGSNVGAAGSSSKAADDVVAEIAARGGEAVANHDSVEDGDKIVEAALKVFGRIDILINNAGVLRDVSLSKMAEKDWELVQAVHLRGVYKCTKAAWPHMMKQSFGRIVNVSSAAGLYGNFGQVNYSAAKSGVIGFTKSCALEGSRRNVFSNVVSPLAASRMTETVLPKEVLKTLRPEAVVPLVLWLCHEDSGANAEIIEAGAGWFAKVRLERSKGAYLAGDIQPEDVASAWSKIVDFGESDHPESIQESVASALSAVRAESPAQARSSKL